jgi:RsiW-degrading membrane proteinase PrsW (M82 family)
MAAAFLYTMAYRLRSTDGVTPLRLILAFLFGGLFATELAFWPELGLSFVHLSIGGDPTIVLTSLVGFIEEGCKLLAVVIASRGLRVRNARTGLFMGGAVGFGFAAFEDMRYAWETVASDPRAHDQFWNVIEITLSRNVIGVFEHPILSAMIAAAVFAAANNGRFRTTPRVVGVFVIFAVVHSLIDTVPFYVGNAVGFGVGGDILVQLPDIVIALGLGVVWLVYSRRVKRRMLETGLEPPVEPLPAPTA